MSGLQVSSKSVKLMPEAKYGKLREALAGFSELMDETAGMPRGSEIRQSDIERWTGRTKAADPEHWTRLIGAWKLAVFTQRAIWIVYRRDRDHGEAVYRMLEAVEQTQDYAERSMKKQIRQLRRDRFIVGVVDNEELTAPQQAFRLAMVTQLSDLERSVRNKVQQQRNWLAGTESMPKMPAPM